MTIKYVPIRDTKDGSDGDACAFNCSILAEGVKGIECTEARLATKGETIDYSIYAPLNCYLSYAEIYANGAKNFFVRRGTKVVGYIIIR
jgi:hypothetical protein